MDAKRIVASATGGDFKARLDEVLNAYSAFGYVNFEAYMDGRASHMDRSKGAHYYRLLAESYGMNYSSCHLQPLSNACESSIAIAVEQARFAKEIGAETVVFKARSKDVYIAAAPLFINAIEQLNLTPVIQFHEGGAFGGLQDLVDVIDAINDPRFLLQHEIGSLHAIGVSWKQFCDIFDGRIGLVHVKDMIGQQSVPFGQGEIDLRAMVEHMESTGYRGKYVVEIDSRDKENTRRYIKEAFSYLRASDT